MYKNRPHKTKAWFRGLPCHPVKKQIGSQSPPELINYDNCIRISLCFVRTNYTERRKSWSLLRDGWPTSRQVTRRAVGEEGVASAWPLMR